MTSTGQLTLALNDPAPTRPATGAGKSSPENMAALQALWTSLRKSRFRANFNLNEADAAYLRQHGIDSIMEHAARFIQERLAPAHPRNDGRQTPWRGHPVFIAQHGTATCCRRCVAKWHHFPTGRVLTSGQTDHILSIIRFWLERQTIDMETKDDQE